MSAFLYRLGRNSARHPFRVLGIWLLLAVAVIALQGSAGGKFDNSERVPGVESQHAADVLNHRFPSRGGQSARIVFHTDDGRQKNRRCELIVVPSVEEMLDLKAITTQQ